MNARTDQAFGGTEADSTSWPCDIGQLDEDWPTTKRFARSINERWPDQFCNTEAALEQERRDREQFEQDSRLDDWHWRLAEIVLCVLFVGAVIGFSWAVYTGRWM